jgi:hypothetical protein
MVNTLTGGAQVQIENLVTKPMKVCVFLFPVDYPTHAETKKE